VTKGIAGGSVKELQAFGAEGHTGEARQSGQESAVREVGGFGSQPSIFQALHDVSKNLGAERIARVVDNQNTLETGLAVRVPSFALE
jgi:hypothetical protein